MTPQEILDALKSQFPGSIPEAKIDGVIDPFVKVVPEAIDAVARFLRDSDRTQFDQLMLLSGVDYTGGKLGVVYHLYSMKLKHKIVLKVELSADNPHCHSVQDVWKTANWHEREAYDMFGIIFDNHPDLRRILLPDDWEGHPLRKDYHVPEYYRGMKVPY